jgi:hypothetical protein
MPMRMVVQSMGDEYFRSFAVLFRLAGILTMIDFHDLDDSFSASILSSLTVGEKPRGIALLSSAAARRIVRQAGVESHFASGIIAARVYPGGILFSAFSSLLCMAVAFGLPIMMIFGFFHGDIAVWFRAIPLVYRESVRVFLMFFAIIPGISLFYFLYGLSLLFSRSVVVWGDDGVVCRTYTLFRRKDTMLPIGELLGIDWVRANKGFEARLIATNGNNGLAAAGRSYNPAPTAWLARVLREALALPVVGNIPLPPPEERELLRKCQWGIETAIYTEDAEVRMSGVFSPEPAPKRFTVRTSESGEMILCEDVRNGKHALVCVLGILFVFGVWLLAYFEPGENGKGEVLLYLLPLGIVILFYMALNFISGEIRLQLTPGGLTRTRQWMRLSASKHWKREDAIGIELFRDIGSANGWVLKMRWCKGESVEKHELVKTNDFSALFWLAGMLGEWSGAPVIERPGQRIAPAAQRKLRVPE